MAETRGRQAANRELDILTGDRGPSWWLLPFLEARYTRLEPKRSDEPAEQKREVKEAKPEEAPTKGPLVPEVAKPGFRSFLQPGCGEEVLGTPPSTYWYDLMQQYRARKLQARRAAGVRFDTCQSGIPGTSNWVPVGPSVVRRGQPTGRPAVSGRACGIAIAPDGQRVYLATADGGVWRSDDAGASWYSTMDTFDLDPTTFAVTSLACGAIAIDPSDPNRVYVGTGEGDTYAVFKARLLGALPSYRGVGPLRSDDGGVTWHNEPAAPGSPTLVGEAFFMLAVDPGNRENVVAATTAGLYRRERDGSGGYHWVQKRDRAHSSVVVARSGTITTFFAAAWGDKVYSSNDGSNWSNAGNPTSFPSGSGRIGLAVRSTSAAVVYAFAAYPNNGLLGLYRLDDALGNWKPVIGVPVDIFGPATGSLQGSYDLAIAIDPSDPNTIFLGGSRYGPASNASIFKGKVSTRGSVYGMSPKHVGTGVHPDVHVLAYTPADPTTLWACCDGGVFKTTNATGCSANFSASNTGLATLSANYLAQHPTQAAVVFCGFQDNGTGRFTGEECWSSVGQFDGGYPIVNWNNPFKVLAYWSGKVYRATDGGQDYPSFIANDVTPPGASQYIMAQPLVTTPYNPATPADAEMVAYGAGPSLYISIDFGTNWSRVTTTIQSDEYIYTMAFASAIKLYVGTTKGRIYRYDLTGATWTETRLDNAAGGALLLAGLITDIEVDPSDPTKQSIFISFGGAGDYRHVWHFDGSVWQARSGPSPGASTSLLDVEHNALAIDPRTSTVYVGADIGVWQSTDGGLNWSAFENGLPDAAVLDLKLHAGSRRLRAALHGRGVFEYKLDPPVPPNVELYIRDTTLDLGLVPTIDNLDDPASWPPQPVHHWESPNIKIDVPTLAGWQTPTSSIDFYQFNEITDGSAGVAALDPSAGTVTNRVYVEVHNRGIVAAPTVQVMLLLADASVSLSLPAGYMNNVISGTPINSPPWQTVDIKVITNLRVGVPRVVEFDLPSTMLPPPASLPGDAHYCLVAILHSPGNDVFASTTTGVDSLTVTDRKVAQKNLHIMQFVGSPSGAATVARWIRIMIGTVVGLKPPYQLEFDVRGFPGQLGLLIPKGLLTNPKLKPYPSGQRIVKRWSTQQRANLAGFVRLGRFDRARCSKMTKEIDLVKNQSLLSIPCGQGRRVIVELNVPKRAPLPVFVRIEPPTKMSVGQVFTFKTAMLGASGTQRGGGCTYRIEMVAAQRKSNA
jgi:hypothetical protein